jgi:hypothetical protein
MELDGIRNLMVSAIPGFIEPAAFLERVEWAAAQTWRGDVVRAPESENQFWMYQLSSKVEDRTAVSGVFGMGLGATREGECYLFSFTLTDFLIEQALGSSMVMQTAIHYHVVSDWGDDVRAFEGVDAQSIFSEISRVMVAR